MFRIIVTEFEPNGGPVKPREVIECDGLMGAFKIWGKRCAVSNGGVAIVDEHDCVWADFRNATNIDLATPEQRRFYALTPR